MYTTHHQTPRVLSYTISLAATLTIWPQMIEEGGSHWSKRTMVPNAVRSDLWEEEVACDEAQTLDPPEKQICAVAAATDEKKRPSTVHEKRPSGHPIPSGSTLASSSGTTGYPLSRIMSLSGSGRVVSRYGVICLVGSTVDAVARRMSGQVPELARRIR